MRKFSADFDLNQLQDWHPEALRLLSNLSKYCYHKEIPLHLTSGMRARYDGFSKSKVHGTARGFDVRIRHWNKEQLKDVLRWLSGYQHTEGIGAISSSDGIKRIAYHHNHHLHCQVAP